MQICSFLFRLEVQRKNIWLFEHRVYNLQHEWKAINYFDFSTGFVSTWNKAKSNSPHAGSVLFNPDNIKTG